MGLSSTIVSAFRFRNNDLRDHWQECLRSLWVLSHATFLSFLVFAVGLLVQSTDVLDPKLILTTSEEPVWSANCVSEQIARSNLNFHLPVAIGETLPPYSERGSVCGVPGLVGFALHDTCAKPRKELTLPIPNGVEYTATMLEESDRDDWTYIAIGGQTSLQKLIRNHPEALSKIRNIVAMGGNWCTGFEAYPDLMAPTDETNIGCDMAAANFVLEAAGESRPKPGTFSRNPLRASRHGQPSDR